MKTKLVILISLLIICGNSAICNSGTTESSTSVLQLYHTIDESSLESTNDSYAKKKKYSYDSDIKKKRSKKLKKRSNRRSYGSASKKYTKRYNPFDID